MSEHREPIPSMIYNAAVGGHLTTSKQIIDENENKEQSQINAEIKQILGQGESVDNRISKAKNDIIGGASSNGNTLKKIEDRVSPLESVIGSGGSIDSRIAAAKSEIKGNVTSSCDTLGKAEVKINANSIAINNNTVTISEESSRAKAAEEQLSTLYNNLQQSQPIPVTNLPVIGEEGNIYRLAGTTNYSDYMWDGTKFVKMATYDNAIDDKPIEGSENLVKSGGVFSAIDKEKAAIIETKRIADGAVTYNKLQPEIKKVVEDITYTEHPDFISVMTDAEGKLLCWIKNDGTLDYTKGVASPIKNYVKKEIESFITIVENPEFKKLELDATYNILATIDNQNVRHDYLKNVFEKPISVCGTEILEDNNNEYVSVTVDNANRIINAIKRDGTMFIPKLESPTVVSNEYKKVSIIGDSISTFNNYITNGYAAHYPVDDVKYVGDTYWYKFCKKNNLNLEVNASYANSLVVNSVNSNPDFYSRTSDLGNPDVIIVAMGSNDSGNNVTIGDYDFETSIEALSEQTFASAYLKGIKALTQNYPTAKIIVVTLVMKEPYYKVVRDIAEHYNLDFVTCRGYKTIDTVHPNSIGMTQIANCLNYLYSDKKVNTDWDMVGMPNFSMLSNTNIEKHGIVIPRSEDPEAFDYRICESPTVWYEHSFGKYIMTYSCYGGDARNEWIGKIGYALSDDAINWEKQGVFMRGTEVNGDANCHLTGSVMLWENGWYYLFLCGMDRIGHESGTPRIILYKARNIMDFPNGNAVYCGVKININKNVDWYARKAWRGTFLKHGGLWYIFFNATGADDYERIGFATCNTLEGDWLVDDEHISNFLSEEQLSQRNLAIGADPFIFREGDFYYMCYYYSFMENGFHMQDEWAWCRACDFPRNWHYGGLSLECGMKDGSGDTYHDYYSAGKPYLIKVGDNIYHYYTAIGQDGGDQQNFQIGLAIHKNKLN